MVPNKSGLSRSRKSNSDDRRRRRSRSRTRSRSPHRRQENYKPHGKKSFNNSKGKGKSQKKSGKSGGGSSSKKPDKKGTFIPESLSEAWENYFSPVAIMMVTAVGLITSAIPALHQLPLGGRISKCINNWRKIIDNDWVLNVVEEGYRIPLNSLPFQRKIPSNPLVSGEAHNVLVNEALDLKLKAAVSVVSPEPSQYISSYFAVPKPHRDNQFRPILNLKNFNKFVKKYKFSMETLSAVRDWLRPNAFCIGLDIKDAFLHIKINQESKKFLRFKWLGELLQWEVLVFGLTCSPRVITKVLKPVVAFLRATWSILISIYIDDILIQADNPEQCSLHCQIAMLVFLALGWSFKFEKCNFIPSQKFCHLGFDFDTVAMKISCPSDKVVKLQDMCNSLLLTQVGSVLQLEKLIGTMESVKPATPLAAIHYRSLQSQLLSAKHGTRDPDKTISLSQKSLLDLKWWVSPDGFQANCSAPIRELEPTVEVWSDANLVMGGAHNSRGEFQQRPWSDEEQNMHINQLEIRAAREALVLTRPGDRVRLHIDSKTAATYIRKQGGTKSSVLCQEALSLWTESIDRGITLLTPHWLSTTENVMADFLSRCLMTQWECMLSRKTFLTVLAKFQVSPTLDVFASQETKQLPRYMSWYPDSMAVARDAMIHPWDQTSYIFPPVPLIMKSLQKIRKEKITAVMIIPKWPSALWWPMVTEMLLTTPLTLPSYRDCVIMMDSSMTPPYLNPLVAVHLRG